jgi:hypothetical protein
MVDVNEALHGPLGLFTKIESHVVQVIGVVVPGTKPVIDKQGK